MSDSFRKQELFLTSRRRAHHGQTLIVALAVLFVLLIIGSLFVTEVARNLTAAGRSSDTQAAEALAEAGIRYSDQQLTQSELGADWRPTPSGATNLTDPDYEWLAQGFTRIPMRGGRALVRLTYDPRPDNPRSQYIKIESIGRPGELGATEDPTVFAQQGNVPRLRSERVAYKQIGLTDYSLFITDKTRSGVADFLGWPAGPHNTSVVIGDPTTAEFPAGENNNQLILNGAVRCNTNLNLGGDFFLYAGARGNVDSSGNPEPLLSNEGMYVAGNINLLPTRDVNGDGSLGSGDLQAHVDQIINYPGLINNPATDPAQSGNLIRSSSDPLYSTHGGYVRDGSAATDVNGFTRDTPRLDPPSIDATVAGTNTMRYRAITRDSGEWITDSNGNPQNTGLYGWGAQGIYVDNSTDLQPETFTPGINGGYSLPREWLNPQVDYADGAWQGPDYRPPSVNVYLEGDHIVMVRDDGKSWLKPDGTPIAPGGASAINIPLSDAARRNHTFPDGVTVYVPPYPHDGDDPTSYSVANPSPYGDPNSYGVNVVIMLEGNVSVRGVYGAITDPMKDLNAPQLSRVHLTIVTGGTAYITGNLVKGDGYIDPNTHVVHSERNSTCAILAKDYVCVNTTLFNSSQSNAAAWTELTPGSSTMTTEVGAQNPYSFDFSFGVDPTTYGMPAYVMLSHAGVAPGPSYLNMLINPALGTTTADGDNSANYLFEFTNEPPASTSDPFDVPYAVGQSWTGSAYFTSTVGVAPNFEQIAFPLEGHIGVLSSDLPNDPVFLPTAPYKSWFPTLAHVPANASAPPVTGYDNTIQLQLDTLVDPSTGAFSGAYTNYLMSSAEVAPNDIRIEALLYAENRSFFVIPGYPFNSDTADTRQALATNGTRHSYGGAYTGLNALIPFYNEPADVRITIFGAICENYTASSSDQKAWLQKWGYIPATLGSSGINIPTDHLKVHDPSNAPYNPAEDKTTDFRTPFESQIGVPAKYADFPLTRGFRLVYDPAFAMPYQAPTDPTLPADNRGARSLRFIDTKVVNPNTNSDFIQTLPPIPDLPVCPGLLYFGASDQPIS